MSLTVQMVIGTILGILVGLFFGEPCGALAPWSAAYVSILKITIIPYLIVTIIHGIGQFTSSQARTILARGALFFGIAWAINVGMVYFARSLFPTGSKGQLARYVSPQETDFNLGELLIPENIFYDLSHSIMPAIVVFAVLMGIALLHLPHKAPLMGLLEVLIGIFTKITAGISRITPIGTFLIMAQQVGTVEFSTIQQIGSYILIYVLTVSLITFWIYPRLTSALTPMHPSSWLKLMVPTLVLAYTTSVVIVCLPFIMQMIQEQLQKNFPKEESMQNLVQGTISVIFNLPISSILLGVFVFFAALLYGTPLASWQQLQLFLFSTMMGLGSVGIGSWINNTTFLFNTLNLPAQGLNLYLTTIPFTSGFQAMMAVMQIASLSWIVVLSCHKRLHYRSRPILVKSAIVATPLVLLVVGGSIYNPLPKIHNRAPTLSEFTLETNLPVRMATANTRPPRSGQDLLATIEQSGVLRIGVYPHIPPFCFRNLHGDVVGYDVALAAELAKDLGCTLELVPLQYDLVPEQLDAYRYDIAMGAISVTVQRLSEILFTEPYSNTKLVLLVPDSYKNSYQSLPRVQQVKGLKIAVLEGTSYAMLAKQLFPNAEIVPLSQMDEAGNPTVADAIFWQEQMALPWLANHPTYRIVYTTPSLGSDSLSYGVRHNEERLLEYLDQWLELKKNSGFIEAQQKIWIEGDLESREPPVRRWSILQDVLGWKPRFP